MHSKSVKKFVLTCCRLLVAVLMVGVADAYTLQPFSQDFATEILPQDVRDHFSFKAPGHDHGTPSSELPKGLPCGETEGDEENKEKDGGEDDWSGCHALHYPLSASVSQSISSYYLSVSSRLDSLPLYLLFQCWKSFLA